MNKPIVTKQSLYHLQNVNATSFDIDGIAISNKQQTDMPMQSLRIRLGQAGRGEWVSIGVFTCKP